MTNFRNLMAMWPIPFAVLLCALMITFTASETVTIPAWLTELRGPEAPDAEKPAPKPAPETTAPGVPYAPAPGRDDRTPPAFMSHVFGLDDPDLPAKLTGVGPVFWQHAGRGTGAMISPTVVLTTAHLFVERGKWKGPMGRTDKPPHPGDGRIWLDACGQAYDFASIELGSLSPRSNLGVDYAIATLSQPVCAEAILLPVSLGPDDIAAGGDDQVFLDIGAYGVSEIPRYASHPLFTGRAPRADGMHELGLFGVVCTPVQNQATKPTPEGSTGLIVTEGCDGRPGSSGGPALLSRDGGTSYSIVGVSNSYRKTDPEYNNYTRIEGALAKHLARHVDLQDLPAATGATLRTTPVPIPGPWLPTTTGGAQ